MAWRMTAFFLGMALWPGVGLADPAADAQSRGALVFHNHCDFCHSAQAEDGDGNGPNLAGVVGRAGGALPKFEYSFAMRQSGLTWTAETLTAFVQDPDRLVPGTKMARKYRPPAPEEVADLIAYLAGKSPVPGPISPNP